MNEYISAHFQYFVELRVTSVGIRYRYDLQRLSRECLRLLLLIRMRLEGRINRIRTHFINSLSLNYSLDVKYMSSTCLKKYF